MKSRGSIVLLTAWLGAGAILAGCSEESDSTTSATTPAPAAWNPAAGQDFAEPEQIEGQDGVVEVALTARRETIEVAGSPLVAQPFNGQFVGPTLNVVPGETIEMTLDNQTDEPTNIHFHGFHVSPEGISDNVFRKMEPNMVHDVRVEVPPEQEPGMYWYHVHYHGNTEKQVFGGMSGAIIVEGLTDLLPADLSDVEEKQIVLKDVQTDPNRMDEIASPENIAPDKATTRLVNGMLRPAMDLDSGETELWHIGNFGADLFYKVRLTGHEFLVVAEDGYPVWETWEADELVIPPGKRFDVLVTGGEPGDYELGTRYFDEGFQRIDDHRLATVEVAGPSETSTAEMPASMSDDASLAGARIAERREFTFSLKTKGTFEALINGETFDPDVIDVAPTLGTVEEWTLKNASIEDHPFHIHVNDFQVMSVNGKPYDARGLQDVVTIPKDGGEVVIRNPFQDYPGEFVFHCHILGHEDAGMMMTVDVVRPGEKPGHQGARAAHAEH